MKKFKLLISLILVIITIILSLALTGCEHVRIDAQIGEVVTFGEHDWRVLDIKDGKALLLSERVIVMKAYDEDEAKKSVNWEHSSIRRCLNNEFSNSVFSRAERRRINNTSNTNRANPWYSNSVGGNTTNDKIFLLSLDEVLRYFGDSGMAANRPDEDTHLIEDEFNDGRIAYDLGVGKVRCRQVADIFSFLFKQECPLSNLLNGFRL